MKRSLKEKKKKVFNMFHRINAQLNELSSQIISKREREIMRPEYIMKHFPTLGDNCLEIFEKD